MKRGAETILVVNDEEVMRLTAWAILEGLGYDVIFAENGRRALELFQIDGHKIDLVLLDMMMPIMNGRDCFIELQKLVPEVCAVASSGFSREEDLEEFKTNGLRGFIRKPYRSTSLCQVVHDALK